ncbi:MAG: hypothetical protein RR923_05460 [Bacilli bacterium]
MTIKKITGKQLFKAIKRYCLFFPILTLIFIFIGIIISQIYILNIQIEEEKVNVLILQDIINKKEVNSSIEYIKNGIETMNKLESFKTKKSELDKISISISENRIQDISDLNVETLKLNKILLENSEAMKIIIKNEKINGIDKLFFIHTYKKDNVKDIMKSIVVLSNIFGNFILIWFLFIIYGKRR